MNDNNLRHGRHRDPTTEMTTPSSLIRWALLVGVTLLTVGLSAGIALESALAIVPLATLIPALIVLLRRTWHIVGWLLLVIAAINAAQFSEEGLTALLAPEWIAWVYTVLNVTFWAAMAAVVAVFPDGLRQQSGRPGAVDRVIVAIAGAATLLSALTVEVQAAGWSGPTDPPFLQNPLGIGFLPQEAGIVLTVVAGLAFIAATVTLVVRTRQAMGAVRQQHMWVLFPFAFLVAGVPVAITITELRGEPGSEWLIAIFGYIAIPICFGVAMTRYRLYDIGKVISRTVTYTLVIALLAAVYAGAALLLTQVLPVDSNLAVAAATLTAAALFTPLRTRVQRIVDRRFNRTRYQADMELEALTARLRDVTAVDDVEADLSGLIHRTLQPATLGIWIRGPESQDSH